MASLQEMVSNQAWRFVYMKLNQYRTIFAITTILLVSIMSTPVINTVVRLPNAAEAPFSELWVLGLNHTISEYPGPIKVGERRNIILGVRNHLNAPAYYMLKAKFRNETQPFPDALKGESSTLPSLYEFRFFLDNSETWEYWFNFSISSATFSQESCLVNTFLVNDVPLFVNITQRLNPIKKGFYYQLFFELWLYDSTFQSLGYHGRFVSIWLNLNE